jgi:hypothetical protein
MCDTVLTMPGEGNRVPGVAVQVATIGVRGLSLYLFLSRKLDRHLENPVYRAAGQALPL